MRPMKDSGVEWIGKIPEDWTVSRVKYYYDCLDGKRVPIDSAERKEGPYPYWGAGSITDYVSDYLFDEELVLVGEDGAPFFDKSRPVSFLINEKVWINNHIHVLKMHKGVCSRFMVYFFNTVDYGSYINGSILNKLTQSNMNNISCVIPSYEDQQRIADYLDRKCAAIDSIIEKQQKIIEKLKEYKLSIITEAVTKGLNPDVEMKDSGVEWIGNVPMAWTVCRMKNIYQKVKNAIKVGPFGSQLTTNDYVDEGVWVYNQRVVLNNDFELNDTFISEEKFSQMQGFVVETDDILITTRGTGTTGHIARVPKDHKEGILHPCLMKFKLNEDKCLYSFLYYVFEYGSYIRKQIDFASNTSSLPVLYSNTVNNLYIAIPNIDEQRSICDCLDQRIIAIDKKIQKKQKITSKLQEYKKSLIYEVVTGKKEVSDAN